MSVDLWRPTAGRAALGRRAAMLARTRAFFAARGVMEVDTPVVVNAPVTDVHIHSAEVSFPGSDAPYFLHTSPEYAMKRLLAAGSGDIFQICHVVRGMERGRLHNAEFTLVEWYRLGFTLQALMREVGELANELLACTDRNPHPAIAPASAAAPRAEYPAEQPSAEKRPTEYLSYREAFLRELAMDPFSADMAGLREAALEAGFQGAGECNDRDELLDVLMATRVGPRLGRDSLCFVHRYPASQAALAQIDAEDPRCALRFELYCEGVELANGFKELASAAEQRARFEHDRALRRSRGLPVQPIDELLLAALDAGLPDCSGVALGFDRLAMLAGGAQDIDAVLPFPIERA